MSNWRSLLPAADDAGDEGQRTRAGQGTMAPSVGGGRSRSSSSPGSSTGSRKRAVPRANCAVDNTPSDGSPSAGTPKISKTGFTWTQSAALPEALERAALVALVQAAKHSNNSQNLVVNPPTVVPIDPYAFAFARGLGDQDIRRCLGSFFSSVHKKIGGPSLKRLVSRSPLSSGTRSMPVVSSIAWAGALLSGSEPTPLVATLQQTAWNNLRTLGDLFWSSSSAPDLQLGLDYMQCLSLWLTGAWRTGGMAQAAAATFHVQMVAVGRRLLIGPNAPASRAAVAHSSRLQKLRSSLIKCWWLECFAMNGALLQRQTPGSTRIALLDPREWKDLDLPVSDVVEEIEDELEVSAAIAGATTGTPTSGVSSAGITSLFGLPPTSAQSPETPSALLSVGLAHLFGGYSSSPGSISAGSTASSLPSASPSVHTPLGQQQSPVTPVRRTGHDLVAWLDQPAGSPARHAMLAALGADATMSWAETFSLILAILLSRVTVLQNAVLALGVSQIYELQQLQQDNPDSLAVAAAEAGRRYLIDAVGDAHYLFPKPYLDAYLEDNGLLLYDMSFTSGEEGRIITTMLASHAQHIMLTAPRPFSEPNRNWFTSSDFTSSTTHAISMSKIISSARKHPRQDLGNMGAVGELVLLAAWVHALSVQQIYASAALFANVENAPMDPVLASKPFADLIQDAAICIDMIAASGAKGWEAMKAALGLLQASLAAVVPQPAAVPVGDPRTTGNNGNGNGSRSSSWTGSPGNNNLNFEQDLPQMQEAAMVPDFGQMR